MKYITYNETMLNIQVIISSYLARVLDHSNRSDGLDGYFYRILGYTNAERGDIVTDLLKSNFPQAALERN